MPSLYDYPAIYDAVMRASTTQLDLEIGVIHALLQERGIAAGRILEIGSGTSPHGLALAQQGHAVVGLDRSRAMVAFARKAAQEAGVGARYVRADLRDFALKEAPFDGAIFMAETFTLVTEYADLASHFDAVRRHLKPGGFYLIDVDAQHGGYRQVHKVWGRQIVALPDGHAELWYEDQPADWVRGVNRLTMHCRIRTPGCNVETADHWHIRLYNPWTLALLVKTMPGWDFLGCFSYADRSTDIAGEDNYFMLLSTQVVS